MTTSQRPEILIVGGGYAGVSAAVHLKPLAAAGAANVTLVNRFNYHHLTTILHHSAVWHTDQEAVSVHLPTLLAPEIAFLRAAAEAIDPEGHRVRVKTRRGEKTLAYDILIVALGWEPQFYDIPGLEEHALVLRDLGSAYLIHSRIEAALAAYGEEAQAQGGVNLVVGGGGFTGVELAGDLADWRPRLARTFDIPLDEIHITLVEGSPTLLAGFDPALIERATETLVAKGVEVITGARIGCVEPQRVVLQDGHELAANVILWAGGVRGHRLVEASGLAVNKQGRAFVNDYLQARDHPDVYVIGDAALALDEEGRPLPPTAQMAVQQGYRVAENLKREFMGRPPQPFVPRRKGTFVSVGCRDALGVLNVAGWQLRFSGRRAKTLKNLIAHRYLWDIGGPRLVWRKLRGS